MQAFSCSLDTRVSQRTQLQRPTLSTAIRPATRRAPAPPVAALGLVPYVASVVGAAAGAAWLLTRAEPILEQRNPGESCPTCEGTGYEPCICNRWSDGDHSGCRSCGKTGYMKCHSCGGGGTAVPIYVPIRKVDPRL